MFPLWWREQTEACFGGKNLVAREGSCLRTFGVTPIRRHPHGQSHEAAHHLFSEQRFSNRQQPKWKGKMKRRSELNPSATRQVIKIGFRKHSWCGGWKQCRRTAVILLRDRRRTTKTWRNCNNSASAAARAPYFVISSWKEPSLAPTWLYNNVCMKPYRQKDSCCQETRPVSSEQTF